jgi:hypothetical protein
MSRKVTSINRDHGALFCCHVQIPNDACLVFPPVKRPNIDIERSVRWADPQCRCMSTEPVLFIACVT